MAGRHDMNSSMGIQLSRIAVSRTKFAKSLGLGLGSTFRGEARRGRGDISSSPCHLEPRKPRSFEDSMYDVK